MYFDSETNVARTAPGLMLDCLDVYGCEILAGGTYRATVQRNRVKHTYCSLLVAENGAMYGGSWDTPFDLPDGRCTILRNMLGEMIATDDGPGTPIVWSRVAHCIDLPPQEVMGIDLGGKTFACGTKGGKRVYSHNSRLMKTL